MGKHEYSKLDRARDELFSHVQRCDVLEAERDHRLEWLGETMEYMRERYPSLSDLQIAQLEMFGRAYLKPVIQHGPGHTAVTRDRKLDEQETAGGPEGDAAAEPVKVEAVDAEPADVEEAREAA